MQALERTIIDTNWITILLVSLLVFIFLLKGISVKRLKRIAFSFLNIGAIEDEIEENNSFFNAFKSLIFVFSTTVLSLVLYKALVYYFSSFKQGLIVFFKVFGLVFTYFIVKKLLEFLFSQLFMLSKQVKFFLFSKAIYLYSVSLFLLIGIVLVEYSQLNTSFLVYFSLVLFSIRFLLYVINNKNLILKELFYFILYLCAFEIAPLFILFKLLF
ncbi:DUF4271 domain-containing protein [Polaribacter sp. Z022]|uniref:DUF4271 domain-containing protein n=1 Tax=Polaribacter sp. Z022 TaxID=2927125 RepID=UPI0020206C9A|nr:DUF4271 domain-containing protein [Polaribacter sp. Z022]